MSIARRVLAELRARVQPPAQPAEDDPELAPAADEAELRALRTELTQELERVARERAGDREGDASHADPRRESEEEEALQASPHG